MNTIKLKRVGDKIDFTSLVSKECIKDDKVILIYDWNNETKDLGLIIQNNLREQIGVERISLALGLQTFIEKLNGYGFNIVIEDGIIYSLETIQKAHGLVLAGFNKLIRVENNYSVDNVFLQTFLLESELQHLLNDNVLELNLSEIK